MTVYNSPSVNSSSGSDGYGYYDSLDVIIRLLSITETEYYYLKALNLVDSDVYDETINEPIRYPSNVHGGTGMVGISTEVSKKYGSGHGSVNYFTTFAAKSKTDVLLCLLSLELC